MANAAITKIERYTLNGIAVPGWRFWHEYHQNGHALTVQQKAVNGDALDRGEVVALGDYDFQIVYKG
jgi:hypothetical protein